MLNTNYTSIHRYSLTTLRSTKGRFSERSYGVQMVDQPRIGSPMVMFGPDGNRRIVTSRVVRLYDDTHGTGTYVETANTLYFLENRLVPRRRVRFPTVEMHAVQACPG